MTDEERLDECRREIFRLRALVREYGSKLDKMEDPDYKVKHLQELLLSMLANQPRSEDPNDDPGFWSDGERILCPSEMEAEVVANFLEDVSSEYGRIVCVTGCYDPEEDERDGSVDQHTGFYYVEFE